ncbi:guanylate-binding protein 1 [Selaginella moellendorffii]|uniref:guanylate-binding protein 1 n=1 Tax=Selaginella moellendorffii TaxID=88036 RepID=UPI000D1CCD7E|nr:guanylate-binding protein 1 [Selaginella moellendorffii]|eukprot:XP_002972590.2 guanylate-binding protein 1 [Selaginella moellendorffii]
MFSRLGFGGGAPPGTPKRIVELDPATAAVAPPAAPASNASNGTGPAKAIRLVYCDDKGRFRMDAEAVAALQLVKGPIGVVAVCGRARQGKSFILNQLLGRSSGFQVGPTHRPCTKGLWMWSAPIKRFAPDGTEYNLLLLDSEGIDSYDQTGTYSTQIFSLAVLLSSMFVYNQMGGIDEAALDRLSLVTEMTKHIRVRASQKTTTADELGQFSPVFLWLLRDFYLDLNEDGRRITPREYLESALQPMPGSGKAIYAKNEIRESIRALFPDRHCFTLVRPVNEEHDLQRLDLLPMEKMRSEFRLGLDHLTKFVIERTRPKQLGSTVMTGPMLAGLTQSFLDAINAGAVPTIATSWQNVEENECRRAYDVALETYMRSFDKSTPPDLNALQEAHDKAFQASLSVYNAEAVGAGPIRSKYERQLQTALRKHFEDYKQRSSMEAELKCVKVIEGMDDKLRMACHSPNASLDQILQLLNELIVQYEKSVFGPAKWQKLVKFIQQSLEGSISDLFKKISHQAASQASSLDLKCRSLEDKLALTGRQIEAAQRESMDWKRRYEAAIADYKSSSELSAGQYASLQSKLGKSEEKRVSLAQQLEVALKEALEWQKKFEHASGDRRLVEERQRSELSALQSRCSAAEARLAAAREQADSAKEEAAEWRRKHDSVINESRSSAERFNALRERGNKQQQVREDALRTEFASKLSQKDTVLNETNAKLEQSERLVTDLKARMQAHEAKALAEEEELVALREESKHYQMMAMERLAGIEKAERHAEALAREKEGLLQELETAKVAEQDASTKCQSLERRLEEREHEMEVLLQEAHEQRISTAHVLEGLLTSERAAHAEASGRAEALSIQLQGVQAKLDSFQHELATSRLNETALETKLRTQAESSGRRKRGSDDKEPEMTPPPSESLGRNKRPRLDLNFDNGSSLGFTPGESMDDHASTEQQQQQQQNQNQQSQQRDYRKLTVAQMKHEMTEAGYGAKVMQLRSNTPKKEVVALYEECMFPKA